MEGCCNSRVAAVLGRKSAAGRWAQQLLAVSQLRFLVLWRRKAVLLLSLLLPSFFLIALRVAAQAVDDGFEPRGLSAPHRLPDLELCRAWDVFNAPRGEDNIPCITLAIAPSAASPPPEVQAVAASIAAHAGVPSSRGARERQRQFPTSTALAQFMYAQPGVVDLAVVFTAWPGSAPGVTSWDYELWVNGTTAQGEEEAEMDPLLPTLGVSQRRLRLQAAVDAAILAQASGKGAASVDVTIGQMPRYVPVKTRRRGDISTSDYFSSDAPEANIAAFPSSVGFILVLLFAAPMLSLGYLVTGFILLGIVTSEKREGLLGQLRSWGAGEQSLWLSWLLVCSVLSAVTAVLTSITGYACELLLFTKTNWLVWFLGLWVFGTLMYAYFLSWASHLSRPVYVNLLMFLSMVVCLGSSIVVGLSAPNFMYSGSLTVIGGLFLYPLPWAHFSQFVGGILSVTRYRGSEALGLEPVSFSLGDLSQKHFFNVVCGQDVTPEARRLIASAGDGVAWGELDGASKIQMWTSAMDALQHVGSKWLSLPLLRPIVGMEHAELVSATRPARHAAVTAGRMLMRASHALGGSDPDTPAQPTHGRDLASLPFGCVDEDSGTLGDIIGWMFLFVLVYHASAWYLAQVASTDFSARKNPLFCFMRTFWCPRAASAAAAAGHTDTIGHIQSTSASTGSLMAYKVSKAYKGKTACSEVSMRVDVGQATALLGVNGSGKSSFLNVLSGMTDISHGEAFVAGASVRNDMHELRHSLAYCPQKTIVWAHLSPWEHLQLVAGVRCLDLPSAAKEASALLGCVALGGGLADATVRTFSGGMMRRVQVACAALGPTKLMVLDEPTTATDPSSRRRIWDIIQRAKRTRVVLFATHDMAEAEALSDAVAVLHGGRLKAFGSVPYLKATYAAGYTARAVVNIPMATVMAHTPIHAPMSRDLLLALGGVQSVDAAVQAAGQYGVPAATAAQIASDQLLPQAAEVMKKLASIPDVEVSPGSDGRTLRVTVPRSSGDSIGPLLRQLQALTLTPSSSTPSGPSAEECAQIMEWTLAYASLHEVFLHLSSAADAVNGGTGSMPGRAGATVARLDSSAPPPAPRFNPSSTVPPPGVPGLPPAVPSQRRDIDFDLAGHPKGSHAGITAQMAAFLNLRLQLEAKSWKSNCCKCCCFLVCLFFASGANIGSSFSRSGLSNDYIVCPPGYLADPTGSITTLPDCSEATFTNRLLFNNSTASQVALLWKQGLTPPEATEHAATAATAAAGTPPARRLSPYQNDTMTSMQDIALSTGSVTERIGSRGGGYGYRLLYSDSGASLEAGTAGAPAASLAAVLPTLSNPPAGADPSDVLFAVRSSDLAAVGDWLPALNDASGTPPPAPAAGMGPYPTTGEALHAAQKLGRSSPTSGKHCSPYSSRHGPTGVTASSAAVGEAYFAQYIPDSAVDFTTVHAGAGASAAAPSLVYTLFIASESAFLSPEDESRVSWPVNGTSQCGEARVSASQPRDQSTYGRGVSVIASAFPAAMVMSALHSSAGKAITGNSGFAIRPTFRFMPPVLYLSPADTGEASAAGMSGSSRNIEIAVLLLSWFMLCTSLAFPSLTQAMVQERSAGQHTLLKQSALHIGSYYLGWYLYCMIVSCLFMLAFYGLGVAIGNTVLENVGVGDYFWLTFCAMHAYTGMAFVASALISRPRVVLIVGIIGVMAVTIAAPIITIVTQKWDNSSLWIPPVAFIRAAQLVFVYGGDNIDDVAGEPADLATSLGLLFVMGSIMLLVGPYLHAVLPYSRGEAARHPLFCLDGCSWRMCGVRVTELTAHPADVQFKLAGHSAVTAVSADDADDIGLVQGNVSDGHAGGYSRRARGGMCSCCCSRYDHLLSNVRQQRAVRAGEIQLQDMQRTSAGPAADGAGDALYATMGSGGAGGVDVREQDAVASLVGVVDEDVLAERTRVLRGDFDGAGAQAIDAAALGPRPGARAPGRDAEGAGGAVPEGDLAMGEAPVASSATGNAPPAAIVIKRLAKVYPGAVRGQPRVALLDLTMAVQYGECFGLLGPNGSGKTTALSILGGAQAATRGGAFVGGFSINTQAVAAQRIMGVVPQGDVLWNELSVQAHLAVFARIRGVPASRVRVEARQAAEKVGLDGDAFDQSARTLSGGQKRKLSLAIALVGSPAVLLLDEPTARVDISTRQFLWDVLLRERAQRRVAIILSTHSMLEAETLCTRVGVLVRGSLRCIGSPLHLTKRFADEYTVSATLERGQVDAWAAGLEGVTGGVGMHSAVVQMTSDSAAAAGTGEGSTAEEEKMGVEMDDGPMSPADRLLSFFHRSVTPAAVLEGCVGATATVRFPRQARLAAPLQAMLGAGDAAEAAPSPRDVPMAETLALLRAAAPRLGVQDWSLAQSSLEQVFVKLTAMAGDGDDDAEAPAASTSSGVFSCCK